MTFDSNISTTWAGFLGDLRDKVSGMTNWSLKDTSANGGATDVAQGEWYVLTTPTGEDIRVVSESGNIVHSSGDAGGLAWEYGANWDSANSAWGTKYTQDSSGINYEVLCPRDYGANDAASVTYQAYYADADGFVFYVDAQEGDGSDRDFLFGFAQMAKTWDFETAANPEAPYAIAYEGQDSGGNNQLQGGINYTARANRPSGPSTADAFGRTNPDANYDNFPIQKKNLVTSSQYKGDGGTTAVIGTHDLWMTDESNNDSAHLDTVQDSGGVNIFTLVSAHNINRGIKM